MSEEYNFSGLKKQSEDEFNFDGLKKKDGTQPSSPESGGDASNSLSGSQSESQSELSSLPKAEGTITLPNEIPQKQEADKPEQLVQKKANANTVSLGNLTKRKKLQDAVNSNPDDPRAMSLLASQLSDEGKYSTAMNLYSGMIAKNPVQPEPYYGMYYNLVSSGRNEEAKQYFDKWKELTAQQGQDVEGDKSIQETEEIRLKPYRDRMNGALEAIQNLPLLSTIKQSQELLGGAVDTFRDATKSDDFSVTRKSLKMIEAGMQAFMGLGAATPAGLMFFEGMNTANIGGVPPQITEAVMAPVSTVLNEMGIHPDPKSSAEALTNMANLAASIIIMHRLGKPFSDLSSTKIDWSKWGNKLKENPPTNNELYSAMSNMADPKAARFQNELMNLSGDLKNNPELESIIANKIQEKQGQLSQAKQEGAQINDVQNRLSEIPSEISALNEKKQSVSDEGKLALDDQISALEKEKSTLESQLPQKPNKIFSEPVPEISDVVADYKKQNGIETSPGEKITSIDEGNSKKIADAYDEMKHDPSNPEVADAYNAMAEETIAQHKALSDKGYKFEIYEGDGEPYKNSAEMLKDLRDNRHLYILSTEKEFGKNPITDAQRAENPLLKDSGVKDVNGKNLLVNDVFRGVHDAIGHGERGNSFGAKGEENAWDVHSRMYSPKARRAMTTETRGQNSWVNFGKHLRDENGNIKKVSAKEKPFAEQKIGLLPEWASKLPEEKVDNENVVKKDSNKNIVSSLKKGDKVDSKTVLDNSELSKSIAEKFPTISAYGGRTSEGAALYDTKTKEIKININSDHWEDNDNVSEAITHEFIHSQIEDSPNKTEIEKILDDIKSDISKDKSEKPKVIDYVTSDKNSPQEVMTYGFSNKEVADYIKSKPELSEKFNKAKKLLDNKEEVSDADRKRLIDAYKDHGQTLSDSQVDNIIHFNGGDIDKAIKELDSHRKHTTNSNQSNIHNEYGGSTYLKGKDMATTPNVTVSIFPERTKKIDGKDITKEDVQKFRDENKDLLDGNENFLAVGSWYDADEGKSVLDLSAVVPKNKVDIAKKIAKKYNQKSIWDLEKEDAIDTGGNGEAKQGMGDIVDRVNDVKKMLNGEEQKKEEETPLQKKKREIAEKKSSAAPDVITEPSDIDTSKYNDNQKKIVENVKKIIKAIGKVVEGGTGNKLKVVLHKSLSSWNKAVKEATGSEVKAKGFWMSDKGEIHINLLNATPETVLHEGFHPLLDALEKRNPKIIDDLYKQLRGIEGGKEFTSEAAKNYNGATTIKKEAITDFIAKVADGSVKIDKTNIDSIKELINKILKAIGLDGFAVDSGLDLSNAKDLRELSKMVSDKFERGEEISKVGEIEGAMPQFQAEKLFASKDHPVFDNLTDVAKWLSKWSRKNRIVKDLTKASDEKVVSALVDHAKEELKAWDQVNDGYHGFYDEEIPNNLNTELVSWAKQRYRRDLTNEEISLYHILSSFASPGSTPSFDSNIGLRMFDRYMKTGEISPYSDKTATVWETDEKGNKIDTGKPKLDEKGNPVMAQMAINLAKQSIDKLNTVVKHFNGDVKKAVNWLESQHSYKEIIDVTGVDNLKEHENLSKKNGGFGIFGITGGKLGSYALNRIGNFSTVTKDLWYARTMARLFGEPLVDDNGSVLSRPWATTKEGIRRRMLADEAFKKVGEELGVAPAIVQQRVWDFERKLWQSLGDKQREARPSVGLLKGIKHIEAEDEQRAAEQYAKDNYSFEKQQVTEPQFSKSKHPLYDDFVEAANLARKEGITTLEDFAKVMDEDVKDVRDAWDDTEKKYEDKEMTKMANAINDAYIENKFGVDALNEVIGQLKDTDIAKLYESMRDKLSSGKIDTKSVIDRVARNGHGSAEDQAAILYDMAVLKGRESELTQKIIDGENVAENQKELLKVQDDMRDNFLANKMIGRDWYGIGKLRQVWVDKSANIAEMESQYMASKGLTKLTAAQKAEVKKAYDKINKLETDIKQAKADAKEATKKADRLEKENAKLTELLDAAKEQKKKDRNLKTADAIERSKARVSKYLGQLKDLRSQMNDVTKVVPEVATIITKIAAEKVYQGAVKFADIVAQTLEEIKPILPGFTEKDVREHLAYKAPSKPRSESSIISSVAKKIAQMKEKNDSGDYSTAKREVKEKSQKVKDIQEEYAKERFLWDKARREDLMKNRPASEKVWDTIQSVVRFNALTYPSTLLKLMGVVANGLLLKPIRFGVQSIDYNILKALGGKNIAAKQSIWGKPQIEALGAYYAAFFRNFKLQELKDQFKGVDKMEAQFGKPYIQDEWKMGQGFLDMPGRSHAYIKSFIKHPEFYYAAKQLSMRYAERMKNIEQQLSDPNLTEDQKTALENQKQLYDVSRDDVNERIGQLAVAHGKWSILMNDNKFVENFRKFLNDYNLGSQITKSEFPIIKIPTNYVGRAMLTKFGIVQMLTGKGGKMFADGHPGLIQLMTKGTKDLTEEQADLLGRTINQATLGAAFGVLGFVAYKQIKENEDGSLEVAGVHVPKALAHIPEYETILSMAKARRHIKDKDAGNFIKDYAQADIDLSSNFDILAKNPFITTLEYGFIGHMVEAMLSKDETKQSDKATRAIADRLSNLVIPGLSKETAKNMDIHKRGWFGKLTNQKAYDPSGEANKRTPVGSKWSILMQTLEEGIPGLRENVPKSKQKR